MNNRLEITLGGLVKFINAFDDNEGTLTRITLQYIGLDKQIEDAYLFALLKDLEGKSLEEQSALIQAEAQRLAISEKILWERLTTMQSVTILLGDVLLINITSAIIKTYGDQSKSPISLLQKDKSETQTQHTTSQKEELPQTKISKYIFQQEQAEHEAIKNKSGAREIILRLSDVVELIRAYSKLYPHNPSVYTQAVTELTQYLSSRLDLAVYSQLRQMLINYDTMASKYTVSPRYFRGPYAELEAYTKFFAKFMDVHFELLDELSKLGRDFDVKVDDLRREQDTFPALNTVLSNVVFY